MSSGFVSGEEELRESAINHFKDIYSLPINAFKINSELHKDLAWRPSFYFKNRYTLVAVEILDYPSSRLLKSLALDIMDTNLLIKVVVICPESNIINETIRKEINQLLNYGFGFFTIDDRGINRQQEGIPLIQFISEKEFTSEIKTLPISIKRRLRDAFDTYNSNPRNGLSEITEIVESVINNLVEQSIKLTWLANSARNKTLAQKIDLMLNDPNHYHSAKASLGGLKSYISVYRNSSHHAPNSLKKAYEIAKMSQHGFREGIKQLNNLNTKMKNHNIKIKAT